MDQNDRNRTIALAALFQAVTLVNKLAYEGKADNEQARTLIESLFRNDVDKIDDIYGSLNELRPGFRAMTAMLSNPGTTARARETTQYAIALLHLQRQLNQHGDMSRSLIESIDELSRQREFFGGSMNTTVIGRIADIYKDTISTLGPKIVIKGERDYLANPDIAAQIRALLLTGIRAAVLWQQAGGSRWKLFLNRKKMIAEAIRLGDVQAITED